MSGLFSSPKVLSARRLPGDEGELTSDSWSDGARSRSNNVRRLALPEGREDAHPEAGWPAAFEAERRDDVILGSAEGDTLTATGGKLAERPPLPIAPPPKPRRPNAAAEAEEPGIDTPPIADVPSSQPSPVGDLSPVEAAKISILRTPPKGQTPAVPADGAPRLRTFEAFLRELERDGVEGGTANRPLSDDPGGVTHRGLSQDALDRLVRNKHGIWGFLEAPTLDAKGRKRAIPSTDVPPDVRHAIYYWEYFMLPKVDLLAAIPGLAKAAPRFAEQMFDTQVLHGQGDGQEWLQTGVNRLRLPQEILNMQTLAAAMRTEAAATGSRVTEADIQARIADSLRVENGRYVLKLDKDLGPVTRAAVKVVLDSGRIAELNDDIVRQRIDYMNTRENRSANPGWPPRAERFLSKHWPVPGAN